MSEQAWRGKERRQAGTLTLHFYYYYSAQFFLAVEHAVEFTHAGRTRPRYRQRPFPRARTYTRTSILREVLCVLTLILRYAFFRFARPSFAKS